MKEHKEVCAASGLMESESCAKMMEISASIGGVAVV